MAIKRAVFTEADAKAQWCPYVRLGAPVGSEAAGSVSNRWPGEHPSQNINYCCIGSACMAWRWHHTHVTNPDNPKGDLIESGDTYGSCGLAGAP